MTVEDLRAALDHPNVAAFLRVIRAGETHPDDDEAYSAVFGWRPGNGVTFSDFTDHPRRAIKSPWGWTSAAGAYQAMCAVPGKVKTDTWGDFIRAEGPHDFSPASQDEFAVWCIKRRKALDDVLAGRIEQAISKCGKEWASLPGSPYGQPVMTLSRALEVYAQYGGELAQPAQVAQPAQPEGKAMAPFIIPAAVELAKLIPRLGGMFGGSEVAQRNVAAAGVVVDAVVGAVGAANAQDAVEQIQKDPAARDAAAKAVEGVWHQISEAGSGGIDGARKADRATSAAGNMLHSPSFWVTLALLPLVYLVVGSVVGLWGEKWPSDVRAAIATAIVSLIVGGAAGYFWGQTTSRNRTPAP